MELPESVRVCFQKFFTCKGRACRSEFWWFYLASLIANCIPFVNFVAWIVVLIPTFTVTVRRLHDRNRTGWWTVVPYLFFTISLISFVISYNNHGSYEFPITGSISLLLGIGFYIFVLVQLILPGTKGENKYGPDSVIEPAPVEPQSAPKSVFVTENMENTDNTTSPTSNNALDEIEHLVSLKNSGAITEDEFNQMKKKILDKYQK